MKTKLIFLDIDGTLISAMDHPSILVKQAIQTARANGHKVFLCTGRNMPIIGDDILEIGFDGIIASAGSHIEVEHAVLFDHFIPEELVQKCLTLFHQHGIYCRIESKEGIYTDLEMESLLKTAAPDPTNSELIRMQNEISRGIPFQPYENYPKKGAYKICFTSTTLEAVDETKKYLENQFQYVVHPYGNSSSCFNGEIIQKGIHKGTAIQIICQHYHASLQDTIAFGDSMNDSEMIQCAGIGIAMENACEELKTMADTICESVQNDGIFHELKRMELI